MYVSDWMTKKVFTVAMDDSIADALSLMKENKIKHVPVLQQDSLRGIVSDRDIKEYSPSKATALDIYELHYLLAKAKVKDVMKSVLVTTTPDAPIEEAAMIMMDHDIGCLPVVDAGKLVGIIAHRDIDRALVDITGVRHGGNRIDVLLEDRRGSIHEAAEIIRKHGFRLRSILTSYEGVKAGYRDVVIRTAGDGSFIDLKKELESAYKRVQVMKE
jgi:acetoin utilization protein AcuB